MVKRILGFILCILGFIVIIFFTKYLGNIIPYPKMILPIGAIMLLIGSILLGSTPTFRQLKTDRKLKASANNLIENGKKINVDLTQCEIKENDYYDMKLVENYKGAVDLPEDIETRDAQIAKRTEVDQTVFIFKHEHNGVEEKFYSPVIPRTGDDLKIKLYLHKTTTLYVDKTDRSKYFFDLDFLNHPE